MGDSAPSAEREPRESADHCAEARTADQIGKVPAGSAIKGSEDRGKVGK